MSKIKRFFQILLAPFVLLWVAVKWGEAEDEEQ